MPLFDKLASTSPLAASLAQRTGALIAQVSVRTVGLARWVIHTSAPVPTEGRDVAEITMDLNRLLEQEIRQSPADWFWVHNRWKLPYPNFLLSEVKRGIYLPPDLKTADLQRFNILVRSPNWLGDACMAIPSLRAIKSGRPDLRLTMLSPAKLAPLWQEIPEVDAILEIPPRASPWRVARLLGKAGHFDVALLLPNSVRSALEVWLAGIPRRIGREMHRGGWLINQRMSAPSAVHPVLHQAEELLAMMRQLGAPGPTDPSTDSSRLRRLPAAANGFGGGIGGNAPLRIGVCPGAEYGPAKRWPLERYREVMESVSSQREVTWVIVGTTKEVLLAEALEKDFPGNVENLCGKTTLSELISELRGFYLLLTNDTGTMHLADQLGVPVVAIFGSTEPTLTGPISITIPRHRILRRKVECSPCYLRECPLDFRCMKELSVEIVRDAVLECLDERETLKR
jgi:lipopolysaccharide heptosyltransferase II